MSGKISGVSSVNADGLVIVFCEASFPRFEYFLIEGNAIILVSDETMSKLTRTYGFATVQAVTSGGELFVQPMDSEGKPLEAYKIEVAYGR
jgi:hypothetical protein